MQWTVLIPVRSLVGAKTRLVDASAGHMEHQSLVLAIRTDTIAAALTAHGVARVVRVLDRDEPGEAGEPAPDQAGTISFVQRTPGLNAALREAAEYAAMTWPRDAVAALVGDLPALRPADLADALARAAAMPTAFVPDADGTGTTLLTACPPHRLQPEFGLGSAARHAAQAVALTAAPGLRRDVDTDADLAQAARLGFGPATAAARGRAANVTGCSS
ncbi:MAG: 2-phospho-L-lactate guanylyltransferase [Jatrophihabitantaceae bacterium]